MKIAIVGMGVAGISVLREWVNLIKLDSCIELTVYGDETTFGTGVPFQKDSDVLLMNVPANFTTIIPGNNNDFLDWLQETGKLVEPSIEFYPREVFGSYLKERMNYWLTEADAKVIKEKVDTIRILPDDRIQLTSLSGTKSFDAVHLCIGSLPYKDPYHLIESANFFVDPFPLHTKMNLIPRGSSLGILGTGLTSVDIFRYAHYNRPDLKLSFFSNSGRFKSILGHYETIESLYFTRDNIMKTKDANNGFIPLENYIEWFKDDLANQGIILDENNYLRELGSQENLREELIKPQEIDIIQSLLIGMNPVLTDLWMALSDEDKQGFLKNYYSVWDKLLSSIPKVSAEKLLYAWDNKDIHVYENLVNVVDKGNYFSLVLKEESPQRVDYILNATGWEKDVSFQMSRLPLLRQLLNERILQPEIFGGVQVSVPDLSAVSQKYGVLHTLKVHGQLISGIQMGNNSVEIISESAQSSVEDIIQYLSLNKK